MMQKKTTQKEMTTQIITSNMLGSFLGYMPNPDDIISGTLESYKTYRQMRTDPRIKSLINKLKTSALNFPMSISQGSSSDKIYAFIKNVKLFENMYKKQKRMLTALDYGFSISEIVWKDPVKNDGKWIPENIITRKPDYFYFDYNWNLFYNNLGQRDELNHEHKWLIYQHDPDDENPYGTSVLRCVYWPWMFKKAGYEFWLQATEKFSVESLVALFDAEGDEETLQKRAGIIARMLMGIESGSSAAVSNIKELKEIGMSGKLEAFESLVKSCDEQISYGLTGQSIATNSTDGGSLALGEVQVDLLYEDSKGIILELQAVLQHVIDWTVELNYGPNEKAPQVVFNTDRKATFDQVIKAIEKGVSVSKSAFYSDYGITPPANEDDVLVTSSEEDKLSIVEQNRNHENDEKTTENIQQTVLNGAQISSLIDLSTQVSQGTLPLETARAMAKASFPAIEESDIDTIFNSLKGFKPETIKASDDSKKKSPERKPSFHIIRLSESEVAEEKAKFRELESFENIAKKQLSKHISSVLKRFLNTIPDTPERVDINKSYIINVNSDAVKNVETLIAGAILLGIDHISTNKISAADESNEIPKIPYKDAMDFLSTKVPITKAEWQKLEPKLRFRAFTAVRLTELDYINQAKNMLTKSIEDGTGYKETYNQIKRVLEKDGMQLKPGYWENVYRTNIESAYNAGKVMAIEKTKPDAIQLFIVDDERTSDICRHLLSEVGTGIVLPRNHVFWKKYGFPPYHYQCRTNIRAIYQSQIKHGISVDNPPITAFSNFKPMNGFGGNPVEKESWWKLTDAMAIRSADMGIFNEIEDYAKKNGLKNFSMNLVKGSDYRRLEGTKYSVQKASLSKPLQKEISVAKILEENNHSVYFTPENQSVKNYDAIVDGHTAEFKIITSKNIEKIVDRIRDANKQTAQIAVIQIPADSYPKDDAIEIIKHTINEKTIDSIQYVYLIFNGGVEVVKK
jgi:vacuolar-type H+-ATPase subunit F/Vma7